MFHVSTVSRSSSRFHHDSSQVTIQTSSAKDRLALLAPSPLCILQVIEHRTQKFKVSHIDGKQNIWKVWLELLTRASNLVHYLFPGHKIREQDSYCLANISPTLNWRMLPIMTLKST